MSVVPPEGDPAAVPPPAEPWAAQEAPAPPSLVSPPAPPHVAFGSVPPPLGAVPEPVARRRRPRLNPLAVAALVLGVLLSPLAALFGHIAAGQIARSQGRERGTVIAWIAVGLGYLWLIAALVAAVAVWRLLGS